MGAYAHNPQALPRIRAVLAIFEEKVDAALRPCNAARTILKATSTARLLLKTVKKIIKPYQMIKPVHGH